MEFKLLELATQTGKARVIPHLVRGAQKFIVTIATCFVQKHHGSVSTSHFDHAHFDCIHSM